MVEFYLNMVEWQINGSEHQNRGGSSPRQGIGRKNRRKPDDSGDPGISREARAHRAAWTRRAADGNRTTSGSRDDRRRTQIRLRRFPLCRRNRLAEMIADTSALIAI